MTFDEKMMQRCIDLAIRGLGHVAPNPMVGSIVVYKERVIGEGYHQKYGAAHAEVNAINSIKERELLPYSTLYVNLEPCSHFGKTPPCADLIIKHKIPRVVIGSFDPNPKVSGKGIQRLKDAGVEVVTEVLRPETDFLNRRFLTFHSKHRPYIILKWGQSSDGFMALNEPKQFWFTNNESKKLMHKWRTEEQAILVGRNTVEVDDCELTARLWQGTNPVRMVIDKNMVLPSTRKIFNAEAKTIVFNREKDSIAGNIEFVKVDFEGSVVAQILEQLYKRSILSVTVEGGPETFQSFIKENLWDEARIFTTVNVLEKGKPAPVISVKPTEEVKIETDLLNIYYNHSA